MLQSLIVTLKCIYYTKYGITLPVFLFFFCFLFVVVVVVVVAFLAGGAPFYIVVETILLLYCRR